jgi:saccharopine dehydrogenase-like NADP-dependent oxidoreductase
VVIGATGHFGARICRRFVGEPNSRLIVTSRSLESAKCLFAELQPSDPNYEIDAVSLDQDSEDFGARLATLRPFLVIHTAGPYQDQDYRVARACIRCGSHYVDLADGRAFVAGFSELDVEAKIADLLLVSGASTLPGLSSAVLESMAPDFRAIRHVEISIAPAHQTPRGRGTIKAVLSYCGKPFEVLENGRWVTRHGWQNLRLQSYPALGRRLSGACDVPDLSLFPAKFDGLETATFHAALEAWWEQLFLFLMAGARRIGVVHDWSKFAGSFERLSRKMLNLGSSTGGMHIKVRGESQEGECVDRDWYLTARDNHGPEIPCSPALVLARKLVQGKVQARGAMPCLGLMSLADFEDEVRNLNINWQVM